MYSSTSSSELKKITGFLVVLFLFLLVLDRGGAAVLRYLDLRSQDGSSGGRIRYFAKNQLNSEKAYDLGVFGSSRALNHIDPKAMSFSAFNLGHAGMATQFHVGLLSMLAEQKALPSVVLLNIEAQELYLVRPAEGRKGVARHLRQFYGESPSVREMVDDIGWGEQFKSLSHLYHYNGKVFGVTNRGLRSRPNPYEGFDGKVPSAKDAERVKHTEEQEFPDFREDPDPTMLAFLEKNIETCKKAGVTLVCFSAPVRYRMPAELEGCDDFLKSYFSERGVSYFGYYNDLPNELEKIELWFDAKHLNKNGAEVFTRLIDRDLKALELGLPIRPSSETKDEPVGSPQ